MISFMSLLTYFKRYNTSSTLLSRLDDSPPYSLSHTRVKPSTSSSSLPNTTQVPSRLDCGKSPMEHYYSLYLSDDDDQSTFISSTIELPSLLS